MSKAPKKSVPKLKLIALSVGLLIAGMIIVFTLPSTVQLAESSVFSTNVPETKAILTDEEKIAGTQTRVNIPTSNNLPAPTLSAAGVVVQDLESGMVLFSKNPDKRVPIASTTKIMTALVGAEHYKANSELMVTNAALVDGSSMGLRLGEKLSFRSLLYGMMLNSGNDAAYTIAENYPGGVSAFVVAMNQRAESLGLTNTNFENPAGFDGLNHYSSASDLAKIAVVAHGNAQIARVVSTKETEVASLDKSMIHSLKNLNKLLGLPGVMGMKTGFTPTAKENLVGMMEKDGHVIVTVVLGSDDRFGETQKLMDWTFNNYVWPSTN